MKKRFVSIWFQHLATDWFALKQPALRTIPFVLSAPLHGRMIITAANTLAEKLGIFTGMVVADARALIPSLEVLNDSPGLMDKLLHRLAEWCIRFTPFAAVDSPNGLLLDVSGCSHLWGGDEQYVGDILKRLKDRGYNAKAAMADTIGVAWGVARFGKNNSIIKTGEHLDAFSVLPSAALRLDSDILERLHKLGLRHIKDFISMPGPALRRRFGIQIISRLNQALGIDEEVMQPVKPPEPYTERLPCPEPIITITGIEIALQRLLQSICKRLREEEKGLRVAVFRGHRVDGKTVEIQIGTARPSHSVAHLFYLFGIKLSTIEPALGIELFILEASQVEDHAPTQSSIWDGVAGIEDVRLSELLDRVTGRIGTGAIQRYLPDEHWWPDRTIKRTLSILEEPTTVWNTGRPRPLQLLSVPQRIEVTAPIPDYPPMMFQYKQKFHKIIKADGPERIEQEWWIEEGQHMDYYSVEDEQGCRYWLFRSGHYSGEKTYQWFIHGFFA